LPEPVDQTIYVDYQYKEIYQMIVDFVKNRYGILIVIGIIILFTINFNQIEHLVETDSTYSDCKVGCLIACRDKTQRTNMKCYEMCTENCWNF
jgi:hypothetical protein